MHTPTQLRQMFTPAELRQMFTPAEIHELTTEDQLLRLRFPKPLLMSLNKQAQMEAMKAQREAMDKVTHDVFGEVEYCGSLERGKKSIC
ncbi:hypothetical protein A2U01_0054338 [Trifolium medium]|uniref:Uncharacterized protein n=1 Tax=Trifolium medium TaxID=97028 RepID=A0A392RAH0_9FABA|nr:hypothetical protein [Trifolium medium]